MPQTPRFHIPFDEGAVPDADATLLVRPPSPKGLGIFDAENVRFQQSFQPIYQGLINAGMQVDEGAPFDRALVFATRNRVETLGNIARSYAGLPIGGWLLVDGSKKDGIDAILKQVRKLVEGVDTRSKSHGKIFWVQKKDEVPALLDWIKASELGQNNDGFWSAPGMFSADGVDKGSAELISHLTPQLKGKAADLGAGWGYLSAKLLEVSQDIESLDLFEAEAIALDAARRNVTDARASFHWADVTRIPTNLGPYKLILSNPPFHQSRTPDPSLGIGFIAAAARLLSPKGSFLMVANQQLPYEAELNHRFASWSQLELSGGFKIIRATRPKKA